MTRIDFINVIEALRAQKALSRGGAYIGSHKFSVFLEMIS